MKVEGNDLRPGFVIEHEGRLWVITKTQHTQPGKGGAYMQVEMKGLKDNMKKNERFRSSESVEKVFLEEKAVDYLYRDADEYIFMDPTSYEQITVQEECFNAPAAFLEEGMRVTLGLYEGTPMWLKLPAQVVVEVDEVEPSLKGQTVTSSYKPAVLTNGLKVMVPTHVDNGMKIVVATEDSRYIERYKP